MARYIGFLAVLFQCSSNFHVKAEFNLDFASDESCTSAVNGAQSIEGTDVVIDAMRKGWWSCAEALAGSTQAEDLHSVVALESRSIATRIGSFKSAIEAMRKPSLLITPAFQWAQSPDSLFLNVKFSHKLDAPATLDVIIDEVTLTEKSLKLQGSKDKKLFALDITFFDEIDTELSTWTTGSVGRIVFTIKKKGDGSKWPTLFPKGVPKLPQMHLWWDRQEEFQEELDNFISEDDDEDDKKMKKDKKIKKDKAKEKEIKNNKDKKKDKLTKKKLAKKLKAEKSAEQAALDKLASEEFVNLPEYALELVKEIEEKRLKAVEAILNESEQKKEEIEKEYKLKQQVIEDEISEMKLKIEQEAQEQRSKLKVDYNIQSSNVKWSQIVDDILQSVDHKVLSLSNAGDLLSKAATHVPNIELSTSSAKVTLTHGVSEEHRIEAIWVLDETSNTVLAFTDVSSSTPELVFNIPSQVTQLKAFAHCNLHGVWSSESLTLPSTDKNEL